MKRVLGFLVSIMLVLACAAVGHAANPITLNLTAKSGVTALTLSGAGYSASSTQTIFDSSKLPAGYWVAEITDADSGSTIYFGYKQCLNVSNLEESEDRPIIYGLANTSAATPYQVPFMLDPSKHTQFYAQNNAAAGLTPFATFNVTLFRPDGEAVWEVPPLYLTTLSFNLASSSGTSSFASADTSNVSMPAGTRCIILENTSASGVTIIHNQTATTITPAGTDKTIAGGDTYVYVGNLTDLKKIRVAAQGTVTLKAQCYTRRPY